MYQLFAIPNTYSLSAHVLLEESAAEYETINPLRDPSASDAAFLKASPHRVVPALYLPDGSTVCESSAVCLYLADTLADQRFTIAANHPARARYLQWLFYLSSTVQPEVMLQFHPEHYFDDDATQSKLAAAALLRLQATWAILNAEYANGPWLFDNRPTAIDYCLANALLWPECFSTSLDDYPNLKAMFDAITEREAFKTVMSWHDA